MDPSVTEIVSLLRDGGGLVLLGWALSAALRLMKKVESILDATAEHRATVVKGQAAAIGHLKRLRDVLAA